MEEKIIATLFGIVMTLIGVVYWNLITRINENHTEILKRLDLKRVSIGELQQRMQKNESEIQHNVEGMRDVKILINDRFDEIKELIIDKVEIAVHRKGLKP